MASPWAPTPRSSCSCAFPTPRSPTSPPRVEPGPWVAHVSGATPLAALAPHTRSVQRAPAPDIHARARSRAARRRLGGRHRRDGLGPHDRVVAGRDARAAAVRARRRGEDALPRGRGVRLELRRHDAARGVAAVRRRGRARRRARAADAAHDRERLRADRARSRAATGRRSRPIARRSAPGDPSSSTSTRRSQPRRWCSRHEDDPHDRRAAAALADAGDIGLVPTMGALHAGHLSLFERRAQPRTTRSSRRCSSTRPSSATRAISPRIRATRSATRGSLRRQASTCSSRRRSRRCTRRGSRRGSRSRRRRRGLEGDARPGHFRAVATVCLKLFNIVRPRARTSARRTRSRRSSSAGSCATWTCSCEIRVLPTVRDLDGLALSSRNVLLSPAERARALALPRALARRSGRARPGGDAVAAATAELNGLTPDYVELHRPRRRARARRRRPRRLDSPHRQRPPARRARMTDKPQRYASWTAGKLPLPELMEMKRRGDKIVMVTAYDAPSGRLADAAGVDLILVGDSSGMVVHGRESTVAVSMDEIVFMTQWVTRGAKRPLVDRRHAVRLVRGVERAGRAARDPSREGRRRGRSEARARRRRRSHARRRSPTPGSR